MTERTTDKKAYVVVGSVGAYDEFTSWTVAVHKNLEDAKSHAASALEYAHTFHKNRPKVLPGNYVEILEYNRTFNNPYDSKARAHSEGWTYDYEVEEVPFYE